MAATQDFSETAFMPSDAHGHTVVTTCKVNMTPKLAEALAEHQKLPEED